MAYVTGLSRRSSRVGGSSGGNITTDPRKISAEAAEREKKLKELAAQNALDVTAMNKEARLAEIAAQSAGEMERTKMQEAGATQRTGMTVKQSAKATEASTLLGQAGLAETTRSNIAGESLAGRKINIAESLAIPELQQAQTAASITGKYGSRLAVGNVSRLEMGNKAFAGELGIGKEGEQSLLQSYQVEQNRRTELKGSGYSDSQIESIIASEKKSKVNRSSGSSLDYFKNLGF